MKNFAFTLVIDAGSIISLILWVVGIIVILAIIIWVISAISEASNQVAKESQARKDKIEKTMTAGQALGYIALIFIVCTSLTFLLIEAMPENLWFIAVAPFFGQFFAMSYFTNRIKTNKK